MAISSSTTKVTIHEHCSVAPAPGAETAEQPPLTYFDVLWLYFDPIQRLLFYRSLCSTVHFLETLVPNLKKSLTKSLKHYVPLAGNLFIPRNSGIPEVRYVAGDSVSFTIAESSEDFDFNYWTGNQARACDEFQNFVPPLPEPKIED